jgi:Ca2+-binding RTX toxin-like protein
VGNDALFGDSGNVVLIGGLGGDTLAGGTGADQFVFNSPQDGIDTITDFSVVNDIMIVSAAGFADDLIADALLMPEQFVIGTAAVDSNDRFIYNRANGTLFFDVDGVGGIAEIQIAKLSSGLDLTNNNIFVSNNFAV